MGCSGSREGAGPGLKINATSERPGIERQSSSSKDYVETKVLGKGASCTVMIAEHTRTKKQFALKVLSKRGPHAAESKRLFDNEVRILQTLRHPNIIEFVEAFEEDASCTIVTGLCRGGELFDRISQGSFTERVASALTRQLLLALAHCHERNISHRDIKPENLIYETPAEDSNVKLIDFGFAILAADSEVIDGTAGSPYYVAPEVLTKSTVRTGLTWKASDMWSVGVLVYVLVHGLPPFTGERQEQMFARIVRVQYKFPPSALSDGAKDFISKLLVGDPSKRLTVAQALAHPWISDPSSVPDTPVPDSVIKSLGEFRSQCLLKKAVAKAFASDLSPSDTSALEAAFKKYDLNGDGKLGPEEVAAMMKQLGKNEVEAHQYFDLVDDNHDGTISKQEFAEAVLASRVSTEEGIKRSFEIFDEDGDGFVSQKEIESMCQSLSAEGARQLMKEVDTNGDGRISFEEWLVAMKKQGKA